MLPRTYRITAYNACTQAVPAGGVVVKRLGWKFNGSGSVVYEASEAPILSNAATLANASYVSSSAVDNSADLYIGGDFEVTFTAPASASGDLTIYLDVSTDGGTTWPSNGNGVVVCTISVTTAGTFTKAFSL